MYVLYYALMLRCWHLVWILVMTDHLYLGVGCHTLSITERIARVGPLSLFINSNYIDKTH
jgi:hypothetical protein